MGRGELVAQAEELARRHLAPLSRRMAHVEGVARQAAHATAIVDAPDLLISAAWLHDIGYAPDICQTGFHPVDGAVFLRERGFDDRLCGLVANHSGAYAEAGLRGLDIAWPDEQSALRNALWWADITTTPTGEVTTASERIGEIQIRYGTEHFVTQAIAEAAPELLAAAESTEELLGLVRTP